MAPVTDSERIGLAEQLLAEAVYRSRGMQAVQVGLGPGPQAPESRPGNCGLGDGPAVDLDLTPRGRELFGALWPTGVPGSQAEVLRDRMAEWVRLQDALDRKRNHFIRDFRSKHGVDRRDYSPEVAGAYERGLEAINDEVRDGCRRAAQQLLS